MTLTTDDIRQCVLSLSPSERASIAHELILSLDDADNLGLDPAQEETIRRRVQEIDSGKVQGIPADQAFARVAASLK